MLNDLSFTELRQRTGMSVEEIADDLGYSASTIYRWKRGETAPKAAVYRALEVIARFADRPPASKSDDHSGFRLIDLFAGIGGLRIGFQGIGGHCVYTSEWDKHSQGTCRRIFRDNACQPAYS
jgi:DNA (cytosine-5)-methyltransferase 1